MGAIENLDSGDLLASRGAVAPPVGADLERHLQLMLLEALAPDQRQDLNGRVLESLLKILEPQASERQRRLIASLRDEVRGRGELWPMIPGGDFAPDLVLVDKQGRLRVVVELKTTARFNVTSLSKVFGSSTGPRWSPSQVAQMDGVRRGAKSALTTAYKQALRESHKPKNERRYIYSQGRSEGLIQLDGYVCSTDWDFRTLEGRQPKGNVLWIVLHPDPEAARRSATTDYVCVTAGVWVWGSLGAFMEQLSGEKWRLYRGGAYERLSALIGALASACYKYDPSSCSNLRLDQVLESALRSADGAPSVDRPLLQFARELLVQADLDADDKQVLDTVSCARKRIAPHWTVPLKSSRGNTPAGRGQDLRYRVCRSDGVELRVGTTSLATWKPSCSGLFPSPLGGELRVLLGVRHGYSGPAEAFAGSGVAQQLLDSNRGELCPWTLSGLWIESRLNRCEENLALWSFPLILPPIDTRHPGTLRDVYRRSVVELISQFATALDSHCGYSTPCVPGCCGNPKVLPRVTPICGRIRIN